MVVADGVIKYSCTFKNLACGLHLFEMKLMWFVIYLLKPKGILLRYSYALWEKTWVYAQSQYRLAYQKIYFVYNMLAS